MREGRFKPSYLPQNWMPGVQERPDCYVDSPSHSIILELKAAELMKSNTFPTDYTLRFPRTANVRHDKEWHEVMRVEEVHEMVNQTQVKKSKPQPESGGSREGSDDEVDGEIRIKGKKIKQNPGRKAAEGGGVVRVMKDFQMPDVGHLAFQSSLFNNFEFYIVNTDEQIDKHELQALVVQNGGQVVQNFIVQTVTHLVASRIDFKIQAIVEKHPVIVVKPDWVLECLRRNK